MLARYWHCVGPRGAYLAVGSPFGTRGYQSLWYAGLGVSVFRIPVPWFLGLLVSRVCWFLGFSVLSRFHECPGFSVSGTHKPLGEKTCRPAGKQMFQDRLSLVWTSLNSTALTSNYIGSCHCRKYYVCVTPRNLGFNALGRFRCIVYFAWVLVLSNAVCRKQLPIFATCGIYLHN